MKGDFGSNNQADLKKYNAALTDAAEASDSFDHSVSASVSYLIHVIAVGTSLAVKLQYSTDDFSADTNDEPDTNAGNDTNIAITSAGLYQVNCPNPRAGYTRVYSTAVGAVNYAVISASGTLYHNEPVPA
jgi:hypothetical protein